MPKKYTRIAEPLYEWEDWILSVEHKPNTSTNAFVSPNLGRLMVVSAYGDNLDSSTTEHALDQLKKADGLWHIDTISADLSLEGLSCVVLSTGQSRSDIALTGRKLSDNDAEEPGPTVYGWKPGNVGGFPDRSYHHTASEFYTSKVLDSSQTFNRIVGSPGPVIIPVITHNFILARK